MKLIILPLDNQYNIYRETETRLGSTLRIYIGCMSQDNMRALKEQIADY